MANRADRRASAKIARQAVKRAKSATEGAILRAAAAFAADGPAGGLVASLSDADFDAAWHRLADDLHDILEERYPEFRAQVYAQAGLGTLRLAAPGGGEVETATRLFLCPLAGAPDRVAAFAGDADGVARLEASLREFGVVPEAGRCLVPPLLLPPAAFAPEATPPGRVRALHDGLVDRLLARLAGTAPPARDLGGFARAAPGAPAPCGALVGVELLPNPPGGGTQAELEAEDMARAAAVASWHDSYAAGIADVAVGAPLDWPACAAALAWETIRVPMEAALRRQGVADGRPETLRCAPTDDGESLVVSALAGSVAVGPFSAPSSLVWFDADEFFDRAEAGADTLEEHDGEAAVIAPLLGGA